MVGTGWKLTKQGKGLIPGKADNPTKVSEYTHPTHGKMWVGPTNFYHQTPNGVEKNNISKKLESKFAGPKTYAPAPVVTPAAPLLTPAMHQKIQEQVALASKIPTGMYDHYKKTVVDNTWVAKFNPATGNYDKYLNGQLQQSQSVSPAKLQNQILDQTIKYQPSVGAIAGIGPAVKPTVTAPTVVPAASKPVTSSPTTPKGAKAALAAKIPQGMHSEYMKPNYQKGANWHAKFIPETGMYQTYKGNGKFKAFVTPEVMQQKVAYGYQPVKSAVAGTGPVLRTKAPDTATTAPTPAAKPVAEFTYKGDAKSLGGAHEKALFVDKEGKDWMFKPATTLSGAPSPMTAHAEEMASKIQAKVTPDAYAEVKAVT